MFSVYKDKFSVLLAIFLVALTSSCSNRYCDAIIETLTAHDINDDARACVSFGETFSFPWDKLYIIDSMIYPEEVSEAIGTHYEGKIVPEGKNLLIFLLNGNIIKTKYERYSGITFVGMTSDGVVEIDKKSTYRLGHKVLNGDKHYLLSNNPKKIKD